MTNILIIPDAHAKPDESKEHFKAAGELIVDKQPDIVICLGDLADMGALSSYDKGKKSAENQRYQYDIESVVVAQELLFKPLNDYNRSRKKKYQPDLYLTMGNHEERINRAVQDDARLEFTLSFEDLRYEEFGWQVSPFKEVLVVEGIALNHYFPNGLMDKPLAGLSPGRSMINKYHSSCIAGHRHDLDVASAVNSSGKRMWGIVAGCWLGPTQEEHYVSKTIQKTWWRGLTLLKDVVDGDFSLEFISQEYIMKTYS
jgi:predicted phosphodiesterase